jgi:hypothetical protein
MFWMEFSGLFFSWLYWVFSGVYVRVCFFLSGVLQLCLLACFSFCFARAKRISGVLCFCLALLCFAIRGKSYGLACIFMEWKRLFYLMLLFSAVDDWFRNLFGVDADDD